MPPGLSRPSSAPQRRFGRGEAFTTIGADGNPVHAHRITAEGWLDLGRAGPPPCLIRPAGADGFAGGATVACPGRPARRIAVRDDLARGLLTVDTDAVRETFRYDPDTGRLLSPTEVPAPAPSVFTGEG